MKLAGEASGICVSHLDKCRKKGETKFLKQSFFAMCQDKNYHNYHKLWTTITVPVVNLQGI